jgi:hypothetical protein
MDISIIGQNKLLNTLLVFFAFIVFMYVPLSYLWLFLKSKKIEKYAEKNNMVKFYIKTVKITDLLTVLSINGKKPFIHRTFVKYGYYVLPGKNVIDAVYQQQSFLKNLFLKIFNLSYPLGINLESIAHKELTITAKEDTEYILCYDYSIKDFVFKICKE